MRAVQITPRDPVPGRALFKLTGNGAVDLLPCAAVLGAISPHARTAPADYCGATAFIARVAPTHAHRAETPRVRFEHGRVPLFPATTEQAP